MGWTLTAGDIEAAFLYGVEARRDLYFEPPANDLEGVEPGGLIEIVKGVFGLHRLGFVVEQTGPVTPGGHH